MTISGFFALGSAACNAADNANGEVWSGALGVEPTESLEAPQAPAIVRAGTILVFETEEAVSTRTHKAGDAFTARVLEDVMGSDGLIAMPRGSRSRWVVTRSESAEGEMREAVLLFSLESMQVDERWIPVEATVTDAHTLAHAEHGGPDAGLKVAVGSAAGAAVGRIMGGDTRAGLQGAGAGANLAAIVLLTTRSSVAELPSGSLITIRIEEPVFPK
jgi:hypothetical protein